MSINDEFKADIAKMKKKWPEWFETILTLIDNPYRQLKVGRSISLEGERATVIINEEWLAKFVDERIEEYVKNN